MRAGGLDHPGGTIMLSSLQIRYDTLEAQRAHLLDHFAAIDPEAWTLQPAPKRWSLAEIAHHLMMVDRNLVAQLRSNELPQWRRRTPREVLGTAAVALMLRYDLRVPRSPRAVVPLPRLPLDAIRADWESARNELATCLEAIDVGALQRKVYHHAVSGRLTVEEALVFVERHVDHHLVQVERTENALGIVARIPLRR
jgi:hypothetical protein